MISPKRFYETLADAGVDFVAGVPDSLLKEFCAFADAALPPSRHQIAANEGTAVGLASGMQMATGGVPLVYLQNSGLGNAVNPLLSIADPDVYSLPMLLLVGWRGEPGVKDEPQHVKQGRVLLAMLDAMEIPYHVLDGDPDAADRIARAAVLQARERGGPVAIVARKDAFGKAEQVRPARDDLDGLMEREQAIELVTGMLPSDATVVSTTGKASRELYELRVRLGQGRDGDFLTVGGMGHASQIALGIALTNTSGTVVCLDGDGAALMHMGGMATIGCSGAQGFVHVVLNNGVHDSVGGQPTVALQADLTRIAIGCGYPRVRGPARTREEVTAALTELLGSAGPSFLEVRVKPGARADLGRPKESPIENRQAFVARLSRT